MRRASAPNPTSKSGATRFAERWPDDRPVWTESCPCQPFSAARAGAGFDERRALPAVLQNRRHDGSLARVRGFLSGSPRAQQRTAELDRLSGGSLLARGLCFPAQKRCKAKALALEMRDHQRTASSLQVPLCSPGARVGSIGGPKFKLSY